MFIKLIASNFKNPISEMIENWRGVIRKPSDFISDKFRQDKLEKVNDSIDKILMKEYLTREDLTELQKIINWVSEVE